MRIQKVFAGLVTVGLLGLPVAVAAPASAEDPAPATLETRIAQTAFSPYVKGAKKFTSIHGKTVTFQAAVQVKDPADGAWKSPSGAEYVVERRLAGQKRFSTLATGSTYGLITVSGTKVLRNAAYRVRITGGTINLGGVEYTYAPTQAARQLRVMRKFNTNIHRTRLVFSGKVVPKHARKNVIIQRKNCAKGCKWKPFKRIKTNAKSRFAIKLPARTNKRTYFRAYVPNNKQFVKSYSDVVYTTRTRF